MKQKIVILLALVLISGSLFAQNTSIDSQNPGYGVTNILIFINALLLLFVVVLLFVLTSAVKKLRSGNDQKSTITWWDKFAALKSEKTEEELTIEEDYDGISELDNPPPPWFNFIFYTSILAAVIYMLNYHVLKFGKLQEAEYTSDVSASKIAVEAYLKKAGNLIDENSVVLLKDAKAIETGAKNFKEKCMVCHGEKGEGKIGLGPNFTDDYWLHGGDVKSIFKTIKYGVPAKGMIPWQNSLSGLQIQQLASFIKSLRGTNPPNAKEPQGILFKEDSITVKPPVDTLVVAKSTALNQ
ncbi:MAG: cbb3-type cytochrome c oxidase N-terminal domain-containing protein [Bacteroidota bacterium]|nr:cbb3-type cytochrome c oxidase N-terminal domain-containing protein [Bacteroidota bacterium]